MKRLARSSLMRVFGPLCLALNLGTLAPPLRAESPGDQLEGPEFAPAELAFFEEQVRPLLAAQCFQCHGGESQVRGGLRLTSRSAVLSGGDSGPAVDLQHPASSLLLEAVQYQSYEMPPSGKLPQEQIDLLHRWVQLGLPWTAGDQPEEEVAEQDDLEPPVDDQTRQFWSFQPVQRPVPPAVDQEDWVCNPIDRFILAKLERRGLAPAPRAARAVLLRRAYYDLTGLPPSPAEVDRFLADESPRAFERVVDRLLKSPHYGEKWGRHWLDLVRYAETNSYERDGAKPFVWRYRDYVIRSFNDDKPYDEFILEQLAGDELGEVTADRLIATGYYRLGIWQDEPVDPEQALYEDLDDIVRTTGEVLLGLTVGCARCHNHKLDPFPQRDYYRFLAFFNGVNRYGIRNAESVARFSLRPIASDDERALQAQQMARHHQRVTQVAAQIKSIEDRVRGTFEPVEVEEFQYEQNRRAIIEKRVPEHLDAETFARYVDLTKERKRLRQFKPSAMNQALCITEIGPQPRETFVLVRGNARVQAERVEPGFPEVLGFPDPHIRPAAAEADSCGRRRALAQWIASPENPLTARVFANRLWQYHFGRGIVRSPNNFGFQGTPPTHPQLLDWLASELVAGHWKLKRMHKLIMLSNAYQMSSTARPAGLEKDPQNDLFWRFEMRRLTAEEIRDSLLAVNGSLNPQMYGPSFYPPIPEEVKAGQSRPGSGWELSPPDQEARRTIYAHVKRSLIVPMIAAFDGPDVDATCPVRFVTTQPTQSLGMLNGATINRHAQRFAEDVRLHAGEQPRAQVELVLRRVLQRPPARAEINEGMQLIHRLRTQHGVEHQQALKYYCLVALNLNEFMFLD